MLHALALVEIKYSSAEKFLKSFFQVTLVDGYFAAQLLNGDRLTDMLQKNFPGANDLLPVVFICEKLALKTFDVFIPQHTFQAIQQEHLGLSRSEERRVGKTSV